MDTSDPLCQADPLPAPPQSAWTTWRDADPSEMPAISVILPAGDDDDDLDQRVPGVLAQSVSPHEVVIVDTSRDGRHFRTLARLEASVHDTVMRYVHFPLVGRAALRRLADQLITGNVQAFAWAGTVVPTGWIERIATGVRRMRTVAAARG